MGGAMGTCHRPAAQLSPVELCAAFEPEEDSSSVMFCDEHAGERPFFACPQVKDHVKPLCARACAMDMKALCHDGAGHDTRTRDYSVPYFVHAVPGISAARTEDVPGSIFAPLDSDTQAEGAEPQPENTDEGKPDVRDPALNAAYEELEWCERNLGPDDQRLLLGISSLVVLLLAEGLIEKAEPYCRRLVQLREKKLGPDNPSTHASVTNLARILKTLQRFDESEMFYRRAFAWHRERLGIEHADTRALSDELATVLEAQGKHDEAHMFRIRSHPEVYAVSELESANKLATMRSLQRRESEGEAEQARRRRHMLESCDTREGLDDEDTIVALVGGKAGKFDGEATKYSHRLLHSQGGGIPDVGQSALFFPKKGIFEPSARGMQRLEATAPANQGDIEVLTTCVTRATELGMDDQAVLSLVRCLQSLQESTAGKHGRADLAPEPAEAEDGEVGTGPSMQLRHDENCGATGKHGREDLAPEPAEAEDGEVGTGMQPEGVDSASTFPEVTPEEMPQPALSAMPPAMGAAGLVDEQVAASAAEAEHDEAQPARAGGADDSDLTVMLQSTNEAEASESEGVEAPHASTIAAVNANNTAAKSESEDAKKSATAGETSRELPSTISDVASEASLLSLTSLGSSQKSRPSSEPSSLIANTGSSRDGLELPEHPARAQPPPTRQTMPPTRSQQQRSPPPRGGRPPLPQATQGETVEVAPRQKPLSTRRFGGS